MKSEIKINATYNQSKENKIHINLTKHVKHLCTEITNAE